MAKRTVFGRVAAQVGADRYKFELHPDGLHVRRHRSRIVQILTFKSILAGCQNSITMKTHRRYNSEQEILAEIEAAKSKVKDIKRTVAMHERRIEELQKQDPVPGWAIDDARKAANSAEASAASLLNTRIPKLSSKLAEFRTPQLPGVDNGDASIPA